MGTTHSLSAFPGYGLQRAKPAGRIPIINHLLSGGRPQSAALRYLYGEFKGGDSRPTETFMV
jgi:hypothetical protein